MADLFAFSEAKLELTFRLYMFNTPDAALRLVKENTTETQH
jgi:hypothetical protein